MISLPRVTYSATSYREVRDLWEASREVPAWQLSAENWGENEAMGGGSRCVGKPVSSVARAVRQARAEITNWVEILGVENLAKVQEIPEDSVVSGHSAA